MTDAKKEKKNLPNASFALQPAWEKVLRALELRRQGGPLEPLGALKRATAAGIWGREPGSRQGQRGHSGRGGGCGDRVGERREGTGTYLWRVRGAAAMYRGGCALYLAAALAVLELWLTQLPLGAAGILAAAERPLDGCAAAVAGSDSTARAQTRASASASVSLTLWEFDLTHVSSIEYRGLQTRLQL